MVKNALNTRFRILVEVVGHLGTFRLLLLLLHILYIVRKNKILDALIVFLLI